MDPSIDVKRVGYLGPQGTFTQEALGFCDLIRAWPAQPYATISQVYEAVLAGECGAGLVPIENSLEGAVTATLDLLIHRAGLQICREVVLPVRHNLLVREDVEFSRVKGILSHPQALAQCADYLRRTFPGIPQEAANSTADAARRVAETGRPGEPLQDWAAIGTATAGELYGLKTLSRDIQDSDENYTRFFLLASGDAAPTGQDKTSLAFTLDRDRPGGLYEVMGEFANRKINLSKIESRPTKKALGHYIFLIEFEGHRAEPRCREALDGVKARSHFFRLFGSYPAWPGNQIGVPGGG